MVEAAENNDVYKDMENIAAREKQGEKVAVADKEALLGRLKELADSSNDFDPKELENILAFASSFSNSPAAEAVIRKAQEQQKKQTAEAETHTQEQEITPDVEQKPLEKSLVDDDIDLISQPSYNVLKEYEKLSAKAELSPEEQQQKKYIENQVEEILSAVDREGIDKDNAVALQNYLDISNAANPDEAVQKRNEELQTLVTGKLQEYDNENSDYLSAYTAQTAEQLNDNETKWKIAGQHLKPQIFDTVKPLLTSYSPEERTEICKNLLTITTARLKVKTPDANSAEVFNETFGEVAAEFKTMVNAEYLKQEAMQSFCEENKINAEQLAAVLRNAENGMTLSEEEKKLKEEFEKHLSEHIAKFPDFDGPYKNSAALKNAVNLASAEIIDRQVTLDSRAARAAGAPQISPSMTKVNNNFAQKNPKIFSCMKAVKTLGLSAAKTMVIGAVAGPLGLTVYSGYKTFKALRKSYQQYKENTGEKGFKNWMKHLFKKENRKELLTLAGQVAATGISAYFGVGGGLENLGAVGHLLGNSGTAADAATQAAAASARRVASAISSVTIGGLKAAAAKSNQNDAVKGLDKLLKANGAELDKKSLKQLLKSKDAQQFSEALAAIAPNMSAEAKEAALGFAQKYQANKPLAEGLTNIGAAVGGLALGEMAHDYFQGSHSAAEAGDDLDSGAKAGASAIQKAMQNISEDHLPEHQSEEMWNADGAAANRELGANANPAGLNKLLREQGVISADDKHFYVSRELKDIMNRDNLTAEQKMQIQEFANDREGNIKAMQDWNEAHRAVHHTSASHESADVKTETPKVQTANAENAATAEKPAEGKTGFHYETKDGKEVKVNLKGDETTETKQTVEQRLYSVRGKVNGEKFTGNVNAPDAAAAGSAIIKEHGYGTGDHGKATIHVTDDKGGDTKIKTSYNKDGDKDIKITTRDAEGHKVSTQTTEFDKDKGVTYSKARGDFDNDGKKDTVVTYKGKDGTSITRSDMSKGNDSVTLTKSDGTKQTMSVEELQKKGMSADAAKQKISNAFKAWSKFIRKGGRS